MTSVIRKLCFLRCAPVYCFVLAVGLTSAGCLFSPDEGGGGPPPPIQLQRDSPEEVIDYLTLVWRHKLFAEYEAVLHDQYEFFPLERDAEDFPWLPGSSWGRTEELNIAEHMFDENFSGEENPIDVIEIELTILSSRTLGPNHVEILCTQQGRVLTSQNDGWSFDTRILVEIVPDPDEPGLFQIIKQTEVDAV
jgi:hypothetical protein